MMCICGENLSSFLRIERKILGGIVAITHTLALSPGARTKTPDHVHGCTPVPMATPILSDSSTVSSFMSMLDASESESESESEKSNEPFFWRPLLVGTTQYRVF